MIAKRIILPLIAVFFSLQVIGQNPTNNATNLSEYNKYRLPSITAGAGIMSFFGDIGTYNSEIWPIGKFNTGFQFGVEQRFGDFMGVSLNGLMGTLAEIDNRPNRHYNFKTDVFNGNLNFIFHFDNGFLLNKTTRLSPYVSVGLGYMTFNPYADLRNKDGLLYYYWPDGTIRDRELDPENPQLGNEIKRDYDFETKMDSLNAFKKYTITLPISFGFNFKFSDKLEGNIFAVYNFTNTDYIDNHAYQNKKQKLFSGHNDGFLYSGVSIQYNIGGKSGMRMLNQPYKGVDFSTVTKGDADGDKVKDKDDKCPDTPQGVAVDNSGCPLDDDKDGVPNYLDKEANTPVGSVVDENGLLLTAKMIEDKFVRDSLIMAGELLLDKDSTLSISEVDRSQVNAMNTAYINSIRSNTTQNKTNVDTTGNATTNNTIANNNNTTTNNTLTNNTTTNNTTTNTTTTNNTTTNNTTKTNVVNMNNSTNATTAPGLVYRVQIGSLANTTSKTYFQKTYKISEEIYIDAYQGTYKYSVGKFTTYAEARKYANDLKAKTGISAFVISFNDGQRIPVAEAKVISKE
jgi:cell division septation protein DedD